VIGSDKLEGKWVEAACLSHYPNICLERLEK